MSASIYVHASRSRTRAPGGEGGVQPPLLNTVVNRDTDPPPAPRAPAREDDELLAALHQEGVRVTRVIMRDFDPGRIWSALEAYQEAREGKQDVGPGLLVWMIREGCEPQRRREDEDSERLRRRMEIHEARQEAAS